MNDDKYKSPYSGMVALIATELLVPLFFSLFISSYLVKSQPQFSPVLNYAQGFTVGGGLGTLFCWAVFFAGSGLNELSIVIKRIKEYFYWTPISRKAAKEIYQYNLEEEGAAFWIYFFLLAINIVWFVVPLTKTIQMFQAIGQI